jgi:hypothetical protein
MVMPVVIGNRNSCCYKCQFARLEDLNLRAAAIPCPKTGGKLNLQIAQVVSMSETAAETNDKRGAVRSVCERTLRFRLRSHLKSALLRDPN